MFALGGPEKLRILRGTIAANGTRVSGEGFTLEHRWPGVYEIVFANPFFGLPSASVTQISELDSDRKLLDYIASAVPVTLKNAIIAGLDNTKIRVVTGADEGEPEDHGFTFVILGRD